MLTARWILRSAREHQWHWARFAIGRDDRHGSAIHQQSRPAWGGNLPGKFAKWRLFTNALTAGQVQTLYNAMRVPPYITGQPAQAANGRTGRRLHQLGGGQWRFTAWPISGAPTGCPSPARLTRTWFLILWSPANAGYYYVVVTNNYGSVTSAVVSLTVNSAAGDYSRISRHPYQRVHLVFRSQSQPSRFQPVGAHPIYYCWFTNSVLDGAATDASLDDEQRASWQHNHLLHCEQFCGLGNKFVWSASVVAAPDAPYPQAVLTLNPIGYWRLNENPDDGNGNIGTLALDYAGGNDGLYTNVTLGNSGYKPDLDPSDTSAGVGTYDFVAVNVPVSYADQIGQNVDFAVPAGSNAEFSVETWVDLTANSGPQAAASFAKAPPMAARNSLSTPLARETSSGSLCGMPAGLNMPCPAGLRPPTARFIIWLVCATKPMVWCHFT